MVGQKDYKDITRWKNEILETLEIIWLQQNKTKNLTSINKCYDHKTETTTVLVIITGTHEILVHNVEYHLKKKLKANLYKQLCLLTNYGW